jgi:ParB-like chromosome segregation protein Spo0J
MESNRSERSSHQKIVNQCKEAVTVALRQITELPLSEQVVAFNEIKILLHEHSPFKNEPVDCVTWVPFDSVIANDYNPNSVAPPEMLLLETSILADGYTQPIVTNQEEGQRVVVDGFHRSRVGRESPDVRERVKGYLPVVQIRQEQTGAQERMASTIRHNRARGKHGVEAMSGIVEYLAKKGWDDNKIGKELGMEPDEVLRLKQITGLAELFANEEFTEAWEIAE